VRKSAESFGGMSFGSISIGVDKQMVHATVSAEEPTSSGEVFSISSAEGSTSSLLSDTCEIEALKVGRARFSPAFSSSSRLRPLLGSESAVSISSPAAETVAGDCTGVLRDRSGALGSEKLNPISSIPSRSRQRIGSEFRRIKEMGFARSVRGVVSMTLALRFCGARYGLMKNLSRDMD